MKWITYSWTIVFTTLFNVSVSANEYIPWQKDDFAIYQSDTFNITKHSTLDLKVGNWHRFTEFAGLGNYWVFAAPSSDKVYLYSPLDYSFHHLVDFNAAVGSRTHIDVNPCNIGDVVIGAKNQQVNTPAGNFFDVVRLDLETSCADAGVTNMWFAKDVGPIQWAESNFAGRIMYQITKGHISGETYPKATGIVLQSKFPDPTLWINRMPPIPVPPPIVTTNVAMTIENRSQETLTYNFGSAHQFDIYVINEKGEVVSKWSRDRLFIQIPTIIEIKPGENFRVGGDVELAYENGEPLQEGNYKLRIFLTNYDPLDSSTNMLNISSPVSEMPVRIRWAQ